MTWNGPLVKIAQSKKGLMSLAFLPVADNQSIILKEEEALRQLSPDQSKTQVSSSISTLYQKDVRSILKHQVWVKNFSSN